LQKEFEELAVSLVDERMEVSFVFCTHALKYGTNRSR
jgi:hypothetical protein